DESVIVAMHHDEGADEPGGHPPTGRPPELLCAGARLILDPARARKILPEEMRGPALDRLSVLRHRFDAERLDGAGEAFALGFLAAENRDGEMIAHKLFLNIEHLPGFRARLGLGLVHGVAFLPVVFGCAEKNARPHRPPD